MNQSIPRESGYQSRIWTSTIRLACWTGAWVLATALMKFGPRFLWNRSMVFTLATIGINVCVGVGMILATKNYVMELDELQRKVYLNALAITVGVAIVAAVPYSVMDTYKVIPFHAEIWHLMLLMCLTFCISFLYGNLRYR